MQTFGTLHNNAVVHVIGLVQVGKAVLVLALVLLVRDGIGPESFVATPGAQWHAGKPLSPLRLGPELANARDFGAACDGSTDDGPAIQRSIRANKVVLLTPEGCTGAYIVNSTVVVPAGRAIIGASDGTSASAPIFTTSARDTFASVGDGCTFENLNVTHTGSAGSIFNLGPASGCRVKNNALAGTNPSNSSPLIYSRGSMVRITGNNINNGRRKAWAIEIDRTSVPSLWLPHYRAKGDWDAHSNTPLIQSTSGTLGDYYRVTAAGNTDVDGVSSWTVSDLIVFDGKRWVKNNPINIVSAANDNIVGGIGKGLIVHASDGAPRPEGFYLQGGYYLTTNVNLQVEQVLDMSVQGVGFDQGDERNIILMPSGTGIVGLKFIGNWVSTPNKQKTGICVFHDNTNPSPLGDVRFVANDFAFCGYGLILNSNASSVIISDNQLAGIGTRGIEINQSKKVTLRGNQYDSLAPGAGNLSLTDGPSGGPYIVEDEQFDPAGAVTWKVTDPGHFQFGRTTGKALSGWSSAVSVWISESGCSDIDVSHGLAAAPPMTHIQLTSSVPTGEFSSLSVSVIGVDTTFIKTRVCYRMVKPGRISVSAFAAL